MVIPAEELAKELVRTRASVETQEATMAQLELLAHEVPEWCALDTVGLAKTAVFRCQLKANFVPVAFKLKELQRQAREARQRNPNG